MPASTNFSSDAFFFCYQEALTAYFKPMTLLPPGVLNAATTAAGTGATAHVKVGSDHVRGI